MSNAELAECCRGIDATAGGMIHVEIVRRDNAGALLAQALLGDNGAPRVLTLARQAIRGIEAAPADRRMLCALCPGELLPSAAYSVVAVLPACDDPKQGVCMALCPRCAPDLLAARRKAVDAIRKLWPDVREIQVTHPGGGRA